MRTKSSYIIICVLAFAFYSCENDNIPIKQAEAIPSFDNLWQFRDAYFTYENDGSIFIRFKHDNLENGFIDYIRFKNIEPKEDSFNLVYVREGSQLQIGNPTAYYTVLLDEDSIGDVYVIDSSAATNSFLIIDSVAKNKISGRFYLNFVLSEFSISPKFAPNIPDTFNISEGRFNAKKLD